MVLDFSKEEFPVESLNEKLPEGFNPSFSENIQVEQKEGIKLTKGQKGTYAWEIKILSLDVEELEKINNKLKEKFGEKDEKKIN